MNKDSYKKMKSDWGNSYLVALLPIPLILIGIWISWWLAVITVYLLFGFILWFEGRNEKGIVDIGRKKYHKNYIIIYWSYFLLYRFYEVWKEAKSMREWNKTDEERLNEKRYKTLKRIL